MTVAIAPNNAAIVYSPYTWNVGASAAIAINAGAYFKTQFTGTSCVLNFDIAALQQPFPQISYRVNGVGPLTPVTLAATIVVTIPPATTSAQNSAVAASQASAPESGSLTAPNFLEVFVKSSSVVLTRWAVSPATLIKFTGLTIDTGAIVTAPMTFPKNVLFFGDSVTEGYQTLGRSMAYDGTNWPNTSGDPLTSDATVGWASIAAQKLNAEFGIVGFAGTGLTVNGNGSVLALPSTYNLLYFGVPRVFTPRPDIIVIMEGYNDGSGNTTSAMQSVLNGLLAACPGTPIAVISEFMLPLASPQKSYIPAAVAACNNPSLVTYIDSTGVWIQAQTSDNTHPWGNQNLALLGPWVAAKVGPIMNGSGGGTRFHSMF